MRDFQGGLSQFLLISLVLLDDLVTNNLYLVIVNLKTIIIRSCKTTNAPKCLSGKRVCLGMYDRVSPKLEWNKASLRKGSSLKESLESLNSLNSPESLENDRILLRLPHPGGSLKSQK